MSSGQVLCYASRCEAWLRLAVKAREFFGYAFLPFRLRRPL